ncbi:uncharacterized protein MONOS_1718 [Monocercomonoides exilis]|uniref:uncharacterized protein n=1 Tax=Monocercomonoides exilis TaxID=2049356 RepID=UPI003559DDF4|nr:hypothetical protein MONOS_1718 [Monocercomonoides exilis]|eukprot:MONOS_1718.1-p1 / transcript=MONOS_1718.1 / gene=MONOS_1718 / organism=Monocercomonoides_exilis_PA203 / gene_product=unspecified product / transcript_product=unspecified product / location=Mono_scaffold00032:9468-9923(+) / protein_length=152 / sequence_SO=supercontig / SO=protein_coding / is_pseudo=false
MLSGKGCDKLCQNLVKLGRSTRDSQRDVFERVFAIFLMMIRYQPTLAVVYDLLKGGVFDLISDEMQKRTFEDVIARNCFEFLLALSKRLDIEYDDEGEEMKRKATKKEVFEKMEEEGYEDIITSYCEALLDLYENYYTELSLIISDYFIYV